MDTSRQVSDGITAKSESLGAAPRQRRSIAEKRRIVEETLVEGASVARVARAHGINANQVFGWRRLYRAGRLGGRKPAVKLLPVRVSESLPAPLAIGALGRQTYTETTGAGHDSHRTAAGAGADRRQRRSGIGAGVVGVPAGMIGPPTNTRVWIAAGVTDSAARFHRAERAGANQVGAESVLGTGVRVSRAARRSDQTSVVRWRWALSILEAVGAGTVRVAAGGERKRLVDAGAVIDAAGRH
jgi:transposase-like protein